MNKKLLLDVATDLRKLADSLQAVADANADSESVRAEPVTEQKLEAKTVTLEQVRTLLAEKSQDGFTAEVRALLEKHGAPRLSEIEPANYGALMVDAEKLK
ncbi:MAG: rRNA biogenesis protein rrp5 [Oscillospiraceae bacterium]|nr:rRNA biogenesis protein rrp5 [Oscillospiraceae bacterium]